MKETVLRRWGCWTGKARIIFFAAFMSPLHDRFGARRILVNGFGQHRADRQCKSSTRGCTSPEACKPESAQKCKGRARRGRTVPAADYTRSARRVGRRRPMRQTRRFNGGISPQGMGGNEQDRGGRLQWSSDAIARQRRAPDGSLGSPVATATSLATMQTISAAPFG